MKTKRISVLTSGGDFKIDLKATGDEERLSIQEGHTGS